MDVTLGKTGWKVPRLGLGTWGIGGGYWRGVDNRDAKQALIAALEGGVRFIDTALVYGDGNSERLVGEAVRELRLRDEALVASKVPPANGQWPASPEVPLGLAFSPEHVRRSVETSLRNTKLDVIPLMQLHVWDDAWLADPLWPELAGTMQRLAREGKVMHFGVSLTDHAPNTGLQAVASGAFATVQVIYNIFDPSPRKALLPACQAHDVGVILRCPFDEGSLAGNIGIGTTFPLDDWRHRYFHPSRRAELVRRLAALSALCQEVPPAASSSEEGRGLVAQRQIRQHYEAKSLPELALRFCLSQPACVIPGSRRREYVSQWLQFCARGPLPKDLLEELEAHAWDKNWYRPAIP